MHAYCLHWLMSIGLLFHTAPCKFTTGEVFNVANSGGLFKLVV